MVDFFDANHRPHADFTGEAPITKIDYGPERLRVTLDTWGPSNFMDTMARYLNSNWGDAPVAEGFGDQTLVAGAFAGQTLQQVLEGLTFWFTIDGVTRAATHQIVRTREAAFMQHGGRDNDWRHRGWTMPETIRRAADQMDAVWEYGKRPTDNHCVTDWEPLDSYLKNNDYESLAGAIADYLQRGKNLYAALVDAGIPYQDARRVLTIGTQTYIHAIYDYRTLQFLLANRLEHVMDWEINCVAQLMLREVRLKCPVVIGANLGSHSDKAHAAKFAGMSSWPPDGKWPVPPKFQDVPRTHRPEQMPFWILDPVCMTDPDVPIRWIPTNGTYPEHLRPQV